MQSPFDTSLLGLGSADKWKEIYEANKAIIADPDRIHPGLKLNIPGVSA